MISKYLYSSQQRNNGGLWTTFRNSGPAGRNTAVLPGPPTTNMWGWFDAANCYSGTNGSGSLVTNDSTQFASMKDMSGNGNHLNQASSAYQYRYRTNQINTSMPAVQSASPNLYMATASGANLVHTFYLVVRPTTWAEGHMLTNEDGVAYQQYLIQTSSTPTVKMLYNGATSPTTTQITLNSWHLVMTCVNTASSFLRVDNNADISASTVNSAPVNFELGCHLGSTYCSYQDVAEVLIYNTTHASGSGDGLSIRQYLNNKYLLGLGI